MQLYSALFHPEVLLLHPVSPLQGLRFNSYCNLNAALRIPLLMCSETLQFISISSQSYRFCSVLKCLFRLSPPPKHFAPRLLEAYLLIVFFFSVSLQKANVCCMIHSQLKKKKKTIRFSDCNFTNKFPSLVLSFFLSGKGFVSKLDEFIHWLNEAMETTENWTPPKAETDSLKLYLETHLVGQDYTMIVISN